MNEHELFAASIDEQAEAYAEEVCGRYLPKLKPLIAPACLESAAIVVAGAARLGYLAGYRQSMKRHGGGS